MKLLSAPERLKKEEREKKKREKKKKMLSRLGAMNIRNCEGRRP